MAVNGDCSVKPGTVWMEGTEALWYVRSRKTSDDFDRLRRAQEVLVAVFKKMMTRNAILKIPQLQASLNNNVKTDMPFKKILPLVPVAEKVFSDTSRIKSFAITEDQSTPFISWNGQWILLPDYTAIHEVLATAGILQIKPAHQFILLRGLLPGHMQLPRMLTCYILPSRLSSWLSRLVAHAAQPG